MRSARSCPGSGARVGEVGGEEGGAVGPEGHEVGVSFCTRCVGKLEPKVQGEGAKRRKEGGRGGRLGSKSLRGEKQSGNEIKTHPPRVGP